jgi:hypothetical protein
MDTGMEVMTIGPPQSKTLSNQAGDTVNLFQIIKSGAVNVPRFACTSDWVVETADFLNDRGGVERLNSSKIELNLNWAES